MWPRRASVAASSSSALATARTERIELIAAVLHRAVRVVPG
jgi:hypothetical protein